MDQERLAHEMLARRAGRVLLCGLNDMVECLPSPAGTSLRITVTVIDTGEEVGTVDVDSTNADDVGLVATRRAKALRSKPAPTSKPNLRLVGGA